MAQRATAGAAGGPGTRAESTGPGSTERPRGPGNVLQRKRGSERSRDRCGLSSAQQQPPECQVPILESVNGDVYGKGPCGFDQIKGSQKGDYMASLVGSMQGSVYERGEGHVATEAEVGVVLSRVTSSHRKPKTQ